MTLFIALCSCFSANHIHRSSVWSPKAKITHWAPPEKSLAKKSTCVPLGILGKGRDRVWLRGIIHLSQPWAHCLLTSPDYKKGRRGPLQIILLLHCLDFSQRRVSIHLKACGEWGGIGNPIQQLPTLESSEMDLHCKIGFRLSINEVRFVHACTLHVYIQFPKSLNNLKTRTWTHVHSHSLARTFVTFHRLHPQ